MEKSKIDNSLSLEEYKEKIENIGYQDELTDEIHYNMERLKISLEGLTQDLSEDGIFDEYKEKVIVDELIEILEYDKKEIG